MSENDFRFVCTVDEISEGSSKAFSILDNDGNKVDIAFFNIAGQFYAISNQCMHQGGPLSQGFLNGAIVTCPWHGWKYSVVDGKSPDEGGDSVSSYQVLVSEGKLFVRLIPAMVGKRISKPHQAYQDLDTAVKQHLENTTHSSVLPVEAAVRVLGLSTTSTDRKAPRKSTSEDALKFALDYAKQKLGTETVMIKLRDLNFRHCEGYYSKNPEACIFPCSISEMDEKDQMLAIYERLLVWADVVVVSTPIRWGSASSLYYQMIQRMNCVQNQIVTHDNYLIRDKVAAFIITGGQDNVQHVAGELLSFWSQLGCLFGKFPFVGWSRGWYAEDTENNQREEMSSSAFQKDIMRTINGAVEMSRLVKMNRYDERVLNIH
jgi:nitrite reductase/ring-hydroxylating ferredoxin subunit/multimeric flavodoxin WrbA